MSNVTIKAGEIQVPLRVMVVDDAVVVRGLISKWLSEHGFLVVGSHRNGKLAVDDIEKSQPDVVILDIEMPEMDGMTALPLLLKKKPDVSVIMASTLTRRNAELSIKCLGLGAADYVPKPETNRDVTTSVEFREELIRKVLALGQRKKTLAPVRVKDQGHYVREETSPIKLKPFPTAITKAIFIGSSTGGPQALAIFLKALVPLLDRYPVIIAQHMPATFTAILAEHLSKTTNHDAHEGKHGEIVRAGCIYVAPGGKHMLIERSSDGAPCIALNDGPAVNFCKPAVDPLFQSASAVYGSGCLAVVLTGMGSDGAKGVESIVAAGGCAMAQDEASSVVWGMPGAAAHTGLCSAVLPLQDLAPRVIRFVSGERS
jgi:two-component system, chemotaxis family, protein-glutamate methylesterase/glutaminase